MELVYISLGPQVYLLVYRYEDEGGAGSGEDFWENFNKKHYQQQGDEMSKEGSQNILIILNLYK